MNIYSENVLVKAESVNSTAAGVWSQYGASLKIDNPEAAVKISSLSENGKALGVFNSTYGGKNSIQFGSVDVKSKILEINSEGANAYGVINAVYTDGSGGDEVHRVEDKDGIRIQALTSINTVSTTIDGLSIGIASTNSQFGALAPESAVSISNATVNSVAKNGGTSYAVYLKDDGIVTLGDSTLSAVSESGKAFGIYNDHSTLNLNGNTVVKAETVLAGTGGTVNVETDANVILDGAIDEERWSGTLNVKGKLSYGLSALDSAELNNTGKGTILLAAGTALGGDIVVGETAGISSHSLAREEEKNSSSITIAPGGTVLIKATETYDGTSPLVSAGSVNAVDGSRVVLLNAVNVADGTTVFAVDNPSVKDYIFSTDNLLKKVVDNHVVSQKAVEVFGSSLLLGSLVDASTAAESLGADRLISATSNTDIAAAKFVLNNIALMGAASGAQTIALNASNMLLNTLDEHGSKLAAYSHEKTGADLWVTVDAAFSKASHYSAGGTGFGYKSDLAGFTVGSDYPFGSGWAAGVAASFGDGSVRGQGSGAGIKNDVRYYGVNIYGVWSNEYFNAIGSMGYLQGKNKIKSQGFEGKPDTKTLALGVRLEKLLAINESITVTPHLGLRYKHMKMDSFTAGGVTYKSEKANLVEMPFGVAFNGNFEASCGAKIKPFLDLEISPNFGDRKVKNTIGLVGSTASDSFDARIANNTMYNGKVGIEANRGNHSFGLNYGIGAGSKGRVDQQLQTKYRYQF